VPRSKRILLSGEIPGHKPCFYLLDTEDGGFRRLTPEGTYGAASWSGNIVSPNGKSFFAKDTNQNLWVYPIDDGNPRLIGRIDPADIPFQWSPDGSAVFLYRQGVVPSKVYRMSISSGRMEVWKELNPADSTGVLAVIAVVSTTDGRSYAYSFDRWLSDLYLVDGLK
jgi:tricorn protease-like protein